jgi:putative YphP/YqiW family bacilliredoxin
MYPPELVAPMRAELTNIGFEETTTADLVSSAINTEGTVLMVLNSVCGCAAGKIGRASCRERV